MKNNIFNHLTAAGSSLNTTREKPSMVGGTGVLISSSLRWFRIAILPLGAPGESFKVSKFILLCRAGGRWDEILKCESRSLLISEPSLGSFATYTLLLGVIVTKPFWKVRIFSCLIDVSSENEGENWKGFWFDNITENEKFCMELKGWLFLVCYWIFSF